MGGPVREPTADERRQIRESFARTGNKSAVARETGWHRQTVIRVLADDEPGPTLAVEWPDMVGLVEQLAQQTRNDSATRNAVAPADPAPLAIPEHSGLVRTSRHYQRIAVLSDLHCPYHDEKNIRAALNYLADWRPGLVVLNGDVFDCYSISRFDKNPDRQLTLQDEFDAGRPILAAVDALGCDVVFGEGNHEHRMARLLAANPGLCRLRCMELRNAAELPARWLYLKNQYHLRVGKLSILHGDVRGCGGGIYPAANLLRRLKTSLICGHWHRAQAHWEPDYEGSVRAAWSSGHLCDVTQAEDYTVCPQWSPGFVSVDMDESGDFEVRQHLTAGGRLRVNGRTYAA